MKRQVQRLRGAVDGLLEGATTGGGHGDGKIVDLGVWFWVNMNGHQCSSSCEV